MTETTENSLAVWATQDIVPIMQEPSLQQIRALRNQCAQDPHFSEALIQGNHLEKFCLRLAEISKDNHSHGVIVACYQLLANLCAHGSKYQDAVWGFCFPDLWESEMVLEAGPKGLFPLCMSLFCSLRDDKPPYPRCEAMASPRGAKLVERLLVACEHGGESYEMVFQWGINSLEVLIQRGFLPALMEHLAAHQGLRPKPKAEGRMTLPQFILLKSFDGLLHQPEAAREEGADFSTLGAAKDAEMRSHILRLVPGRLHRQWVVAQLVALYQRGARIGPSGSSVGQPQAPSPRGIPGLDGDEVNALHLLLHAAQTMVTNLAETLLPCQQPRPDAPTSSSAVAALGANPLSVIEEFRQVGLIDLLLDLLRVSVAHWPVIQQGRCMPLPTPAPPAPTAREATDLGDVRDTARADLRSEDVVFRWPQVGLREPPEADEEEVPWCHTFTAQQATGYRTLLVRLLANAIFRCPAAQDQIRERGAIPLVLNLVNIDESNPFVRESALWAVRNLTEGHETNQAFIRGLEKQGLAETPLSAEMHEKGIAVSLGPDGRPMLRPEKRPGPAPATATPPPEPARPLVNSISDEEMAALLKDKRLNFQTVEL
ncbi:putative ataxin-10 [Paratrimastix pyriformis]|uniref:Ataxin-10 n=1 Tax=Paratrimastix pyriformis TaxID=342808 RepID=A0ABQ8UPZ1_9EUKA|nr:putative ataxin-10 [Paratrimastix pyriformis]